ncbi:hypothetical protein ECZU01_00030 [Escherichia coli]|nr:hypothetical protein ECZU01_00030 [Escherichia coli]
MSGGRHFQFAIGVAVQHAALEIKTSGVFSGGTLCVRAGAPLAVLPLSFASKGCTS